MCVQWFLKRMTMQFHFSRLQHRRATVDGGEDYSAYYYRRSCPGIALMKAVQRKPSVVVLQNSEKGTFIIIQVTPIIRIHIFWDMTPCHLVYSYLRFRWCGAYETSGISVPNDTVLNVAAVISCTVCSWMCCWRNVQWIRRSLFWVF